MFFHLRFLGEGDQGALSSLSPISPAVGTATMNSEPEGRYGNAGKKKKVSDSPNLDQKITQPSTAGFLP